MNTKELREIAGRATPGPWRGDGRESEYVWGCADPMKMVMVAEIRGFGAKLPQDANLAHIATFNPATVIKILDDLDALQERVKILEDELEKVAGPRKRDHDEPDDYTRLACAMYHAEKVLARSRELGKEGRGL